MINREVFCKKKGQISSVLLQKKNGKALGGSEDSFLVYIYGFFFCNGLRSLESGIRNYKFGIRNPKNWPETGFFKFFSPIF